MLLDDDDFIEDETRRSLKILLEEQQKLITVVVLLMGGIILSNLYLLWLNDTITLEFWLINNIIELVGIALIALVLNLFFNILPYKNFTYQERFLRTYLILLMIGYILIIIVLLSVRFAGF